MAACPNCGASLDSDFGMVTCSQCQVMVLLDLDGHASVSNSDESLIINEVPQVPQINEPIYLEPELAESPVEFISEEPEAELNSKPDETVANSDPISDYVEPEPFLPEEVIPLSPEAEEINQFGNSVLSSQVDGPFAYKITLRGIDSAEIYEELMELLEDKKFNWDTDVLKKQISNGELVIKDVNPVVAAVLIKKIKPLSIQISWRKYGLTEVI